MNKKQQIQQALDTACKIDELANHPVFVHVIKPAFEKLASPEPVKAGKNRDEYVHELEISNMRAIVYSEVLQFFDVKDKILRYRQELSKLTIHEQIKTPPTTSRIL